MTTRRGLIIGGSTLLCSESQVLGQLGVNRVPGFNATKTDCANVGMTFGGGCFFGHGVRIDSGSARFNMLEYKT